MLEKLVEVTYNYFMREKHSWADIANTLTLTITDQYQTTRPLSEARWHAYAWVTANNFAAVEGFKSTKDLNEKKINYEEFVRSGKSLLALMRGDWNPLISQLRGEALGLAWLGDAFTDPLYDAPKGVIEKLEPSMKKDLAFAVGYRNLANSLAEAV